MAVYADVVRVAAGSGTQAISGSLNGQTPTTAIVLGCSATAVNTIANHCLSVRGVLAANSSESRGDLTNDQICGVAVSADGVGTGDAYSGVFLGKFLAIPQLSTVDGTVAATAVATPVPDGLSLAWTGTPPALLLDILLIAGDTSDSHVHYEHDDVASFTMTTGFALTPDVFLFGFSITKSGPLADDVLTTENSLHGFGLYNDGNYGCKVLSSADGQSRAFCYNAHFNDRVIGAVDDNSTTTYGYDVDSSDATSITLAAPGTDGRPENSIILAVKLGGRSIDLRTITAPASAQLQTITGLGFDPGFAILLGGDSDALGGSKSSTRSTVSAAFHKDGASDNATITCWDEDFADPTNAHGRYSTDYNWHGISEQDNVRWECDFSCEVGGYDFDWTTITRTSGTLHVVLAFDQSSPSQNISPNSLDRVFALGQPDISQGVVLSPNALENILTVGEPALSDLRTSIVPDPLEMAAALQTPFVSQGGPPTFIPVASDWTPAVAAVNAGTVGQWDVRIGGAISPCVCLKKNDTWYLFYIGADGDRSSDGGPRHRALGMATSTDGVNFVKAGNNPVITHLPSSGEEEGVFSAGGFVEASGRLVIYYGAMEDQGGGSVDAYICLAFSDDDGATWTNRGDTQTYALESAGEEFSPIGVFRVGATYYCYYIDNEATWNLRLASGTLESLTDAGNVTGTSGGQAKGGGNIIYTETAGEFVTFIDHYDTRDVLVCTGNTATPLALTQVDRYTWGSESHKDQVTMWDPVSEKYYMYIRNGTDDRIDVRTATNKYNVIADNLASVFSLNEPSLFSKTNVDPENLESALLLSSPGLSTRTPLTPNTLEHALALGQPPLTGKYLLSPAGLEFSRTLGVSLLSQAGGISPEGLAFVLDLSDPVLSPEGVLVVDDVDVLSTLAAPTLVQGQALACDALTYQRLLGVTTVQVKHQIIPNDLEIDFVVASPGVGAVFVIAATDLEISNTLGSPTLDAGQGLNVADLVHQYVLSEPTISNYLVLAVNDLEFEYLLGSGVLVLDAIEIADYNVVKIGPPNGSCKSR